MASQLPLWAIVVSASHRLKLTNMIGSSISWKELRIFPAPLWPKALIGSGKPSPNIWTRWIKCGPRWMSLHKFRMARVRAYVMGQRGADNEAATPEDIEKMADIVEEGIKAGALGFSTSRTMLHLSKDGEPVPGTFANKDELLGIADGMQRGGHGVFEMASDLNPAEKEFGWMAEMSQKTGLPVTYALLQNPLDKDSWAHAFENDRGRGG